MIEISILLTPCILVFVYGVWIACKGEYYTIVNLGNGLMLCATAVAVALCVALLLKGTT